MAKNVIKEIIILLLICLAIILVLGVIMYEYTPMTKTIPNEVAYKVPDGVEDELNDVNTDVLLSFENNGQIIDSATLNNYERINNYQPGKANPFSSYDTSSTNGENNPGNGQTNTSNENQPGNSSSNTNSGGSFFQNKGTK